ncbi:hypothetical protein LEAN103870_15610 [Legionella anisa]|uniref:Outer membrane protein assembly factor BamC n=1 Tax=Legionella anisa TaxID=28082 RepID=A0AAX0WWT9_9GAMM|nr:hypothetical protein [Legionella anisa]AWN73368.1 hypothetical protein DLD14_05660 [Legionella anisa]KTC70478.1 hypothetical protein Lani_2025 [Legionella anisa]MBN5934151.1 hypothetical protein [Legionella anisa]MCW8426231.1 hypothetical protein [Legionella anisa]MCW8447893.1 hypothetical protein [Legionella anisa]
MKKLGFIVFFVLLFSGCSRYASNGEHLYLSSRNGPQLDVPPPLTRTNISSFYDLPQQNQNAQVSIAPPVS